MITYISKCMKNKIYTAYLERKHRSLLTFEVFNDNLSQRYRSRSAYKHR